MEEIIRITDLGKISFVLDRTLKELKSNEFSIAQLILDDAALQITKRVELLRAKEAGELVH